MIQPQSAGPVHLAVVYVLAWVGCFLGTYLGGAYLGEASTYWNSAGITDYPNKFYSNVSTGHPAGKGGLGLGWSGMA